MIETIDPDLTISPSPDDLMDQLRIVSPDLPELVDFADLAFFVCLDRQFFDAEPAIAERDKSPRVLDA